MADETKDKGGFPDAAENNAANAAKLAAQDIAGRSSVTGEAEHASTFDALDKLVEEKRKAAEEGGTKPDDAAAAAAKAAEEKAAAEKAAAKSPEQLAAEKEAADRAGKIKEDLFKGIDLPPNTRPRSAEAFATVKERAAKEIETRDRTISELGDKLKAAEEAAAKAGQLPPEVESELKDLREWRAKLDVEFDPQFKEFDKRVTQADEFIYAQLKKSPAIGDDVIAKIKEVGGPGNVKMEKILAVVKDPTIQRLVESKLAEIETAKFEKDQAIKAARENVSDYLKQREEQFEQSKTAHNSATEQHIAELTGKLNWFKPMEVDAKADEGAKAAAQKHNAFLQEVQGQIKQAAQDDSPEMRAIMIVGMAQLLRYQQVLTDTKAERDGLKKQVDELTTKMAAIKGASTSRLRETAAPADGKMPAKPKGDKDIFTMTAKEALDNMMREKQDAVKAGA